MLQAYRQSRGSPFGEIMHFPRIPPTVQRLGGWINDCPLQIIEDEVVPLGVVPRGRFSETSSDDDEHSQATTHVSPSDNESEDDEIEKWFKPIPLPPDFEGQM